MCRWMAWFGQPMLLEELIFNTKHGIVDQSLHAREGAEPTNGDGFGLGWYGLGDRAGLYHSVSPAWSDPNLRELAAHIASPLFLVHIRAAIGSPVQQTNCHPFRHGRWLFVHNGYLGGFQQVRRELMLALDPELFLEVRGSTDTELVFHLALGLGLAQDPLGALERTVGLIESVAAAHGIEDAVQGTFGITDGTSLYAARYATSGPPRSLYVSADVDTIRQLHPEIERLQRLGPDDRIVVSEPIADLPGAWEPVRENTALIVRGGGSLTILPFTPQPVAQGAVPAVG